MTTKILSIVAIAFTLPLCGAQRLQRIMGHIKPSMSAAPSVVAAKTSSSEEVVISPEVKALVDSLMPLFLRLYTNDDFEGLKKAIAESTDINKDVEAARDSEGNTIVDWLLDEERWDVADLLVSRGFDATRMLWEAVDSRRNITVIKKLIRDYRANIEAKDEDGWTALMWAVCADSIEIVRFLVKECSANVESKDSYGRTALMVAATGDLEIVRLLVQECGASVESRDNNGWTALMWAVNRGRIETVRFLIEECGVNIGSRDNAGKTAIDYVGGFKQEIKDYLTKKLAEQRAQQVASALKK